MDINGQALPEATTSSVNTVFQWSETKKALKLAKRDHFKNLK